MKGRRWCELPRRWGRGQFTKKSLEPGVPESLRNGLEFVMVKDDLGGIRSASRIARVRGDSDAGQGD